jgi:hypothetical protein
VFPEEWGGSVRRERVPRLPAAREGSRHRAGGWQSTAIRPKVSRGGAVRNSAKANRTSWAVLERRQHDPASLVDEGDLVVDLVADESSAAAGDALEEPASLCFVALLLLLSAI